MAYNLSVEPSKHNEAKITHIQLPKAKPRRLNFSKYFGYDFFISFKLGPPPIGTQSYASDLARRLREEDFTVFFSEDEAPPQVRYWIPHYSKPYTARKSWSSSPMKVH